ncbi:MAG: LuxR C-terminal-related transcriptional regulator [Candidatus Solibacter sp.]|nr:LuxR C-terminal-related transcriptional regulator [Candidatus Solibacter sp.]
MAPGHQLDDTTVLRLKLAEVEAEVDYLKRKQVSSERRFHELLDAAPVMVWMSGTDALCTFFNRSWLAFRGRTMGEELGNGWAEGLHPDDRDLCLETYLKAFTARCPFRVQYRVQRAGGEYSWIENSGTPLIEDTVFVGFIGTAMDVSDRRSRVFTPDRESVRLVFALTERERQVLVLIAGGKSTKQTALQLGISYKTADSHRSRILEKLGVHETASMPSVQD